MEPKKVRKPKVVTWTAVMDEALINAYLHQQNQGNRLGGTFTTHALEAIFKEMQVQFPDKPINKEKMQDHMKYIKNKFSGCYDLFKSGLSGFAWNPITCMWSAEPEVWEKLIESKPTAAEWRDKPIPYYDKLVQLYGKDRATGDHAETAFEMRQRRVANGGNDIHDTIDELDHLISTNEVILENCGITDEVQSLNVESLGMDSQPHQGSASSKGKKRKSRTEENDFEVVTKSIEKMMDVFEKCTTELVKCYQKHPISEDAIWKQLEDLGVEEDKLEVAYYHLVQHPDDLRALLGCPFERRKGMLKRIVPGYSSSN